MNNQTASNIRPDFDKEIIDIANYVIDYKITSEEAVTTAYYCFLDALACSFMALKYPSCTKLLGPIVPNATLTPGVRVPGTDFELEPVQAAFNIGALIRWLDFNDTWLAAEWNHPSDNLGGILAAIDYMGRQPKGDSQKQFCVIDVLYAMIKAYEIQGVLALENSFNRVGLDHVILVKIASTAVVSHLMGGDFETLCNAISLAWLDGQSLRTYRHAPNTGTRKSWAAGDATSRGVRLALLALKGEMGYPSALSAPTWGFYDVSFRGNHFKFDRPYGSYVMENILFKISFPAEFHAQTAVECAITLHNQIKDRLENIEKIVIKTQESAIRIISKEGPLHNPADRDHCLQYMVAIGLIFGELTANHYLEDTARDPRVDQLRSKMCIEESARFSKEYLDPDKRSIGNAIQVFFKDGDYTDEVSIDYPIGHKRRRAEGIPLLAQKFITSVTNHFDANKSQEIIKVCENPDVLFSMPLTQFMSLLICE